MAATLPDLETVTLRRGASNGAELRIELNRPERMNAWDKQLGARPAAPRSSWRPGTTACAP